MIARLEPRSAALRAGGSRAGPTIAACINDMLARFRAELEAGLPPEPAEEPIGWRSLMFQPGGRFDPFAGAKWQRMLASAATCEQLGAWQAAADFRKAAESFRLDDPSPAASPAILHITSASPAVASRAPVRGKARPIWTGANMPPPEPAPFAAGPQLGLFG